METIKIVLLDDMPFQVENLKSMIERISPQLEIVGEAYSIHEAIIEIEKHNPHLVFLDIEMRNKKTSFELLDYFIKNNKLDFQFIFFSAFKNRFAAQVLDYTSIGFLNKPVDREKLRDLVNSYLKNYEKDEYIKQIKLMLHLYKMGEYDECWIPLVAGEDKNMQKVLISEILYIEANGTLSKVYLYNNEKPINANKSIREWENELVKNYGFVRIHRSYLINDIMVNKLSNRDITFIDNQKVEVERRIMNRYKAMKEEQGNANELTPLEVSNLMKMMLNLFEN